MLIEGYEINTQQIGPVHWQIHVITPEKNRFIAQIQANGGLTPEIAYEQVWKKKEHFKNFVIDL